ncbi:MAG TPA: pectin acetylesterase-family hydrolase [Sandaracinaceae bacterium LLY-WYZ-13_1]|nr:pectin acetylesterase-family hydrolase [Sandaracinaceae bacterium LLY-WYZ-13_1]
MPRAVSAILACLALAACDPGSAPPDAEPPGDAAVSTDAGPERPAYRRWLKVELPGTVCGNGSQYKFWVNYIPGATDTLVYFEAGGACWDYPSCSGAEGIRGAAHPDGIEDDLIDLWALGSPLLRRNRTENPLATWNMVFVPYCTGDVHIGRRDAVYEDPTGENPPLEWHHRGYDNVQAVAGWMEEQFPELDRLLVSGCSAGGAGAINNYYFLRTRLEPERGYLLNDSGPIFPSDSNSAALHERIREAWDVDGVLADGLPPFADEIIGDLGAINSVLAEQFPRDRLVTTFFRLDYDYSLYSYERFYEPTPDREEIYRRWWEDTQALTTVYDAHDNLAYYIPFYRELNNSHCLTLVEWAGTEIEEDGLDLQSYLQALLDDDAPLTSHLEEAREGPHADLAP